MKAEIAKLELPEGTVIVCDPWIYGMTYDLVTIEYCSNKFS